MNVQRRLLALKAVAGHLFLPLAVIAWERLPILVDAPAEATFPTFRRAALLLLVKALLVTVWDMDASGTQNVEKLQVIQCVLHLPAAGTVFCLPLGLGGEVLGVGALGLIVNFVALAVLGVPFLDDVHLGVGVEFGVSHSVCAGQGSVLHTTDAMVLF